MPTELRHDLHPELSVGDSPPPTIPTGVPDCTLRRCLVFWLVLNAIAACALAIDLPVARYLVRDHGWEPVHDLLESIEPFGQPAAVVLAGLAIALCDSQRRRGVPRFLAAALGAGLAADLVKLLIARVRPYHFDLAGTAAGSFAGLLPGLGTGSEWQSCPSAHTAVATGFCFALSRFFPGGRSLFIAAAGLVALQRVECGAHFISDTLWGAALAYGYCVLLYHPRLLGTWFDERARFAAPVRGDHAPPGTPHLSVARSESASPRESHHSLNSAARLRTATTDITSLSVVVPLLDEEENLEALHAALTPVLAGLQLPYEMIFVDDGSRDSSPRVLERLSAADRHVTVIRFAHNRGQSVALLAGIQHATGDAVALLDADLQNDPGDIPEMLSLLRQGYDLVHGWRRLRHDRLLDRRLPSLAANRLISWITGYRVHDTGCTLKLLRRELAQSLPLFGGLHRFIPALAHARGARCIEATARHHPRRFGRSKYGLSRIVRVLADLVLVKCVSLAMRRQTAALDDIAALATVSRGAAPAGLSRSVARHAA